MDMECPRCAKTETDQEGRSGTQGPRRADVEDRAKYNAAFESDETGRISSRDREAADAANFFFCFLIPALHAN